MALQICKGIQGRRGLEYNIQKEVIVTLLLDSYMEDIKHLQYAKCVQGSENAAQMNQNVRNSDEQHRIQRNHAQLSGDG